MDTETSNEYTVYDILNILLDSSEIKVNLSLERQITAMLTLIDLGDNIKYCDPEYVDQLYASMEFGIFNEKMKNWVSNMAGTMAHKGIMGFTKGLRSVIEQTGTMIDGLSNERKRKKLSDVYINKRFYRFNMLIERAKAYPECFVKGAAEYEKMMSRFEGLQNMCEKVNDMAEASDDQSFMSDKIWDEFASASNTVCRAEDPQPGSTFRNFRWLSPYTKSFDFKKSKWNNKTSIEECKQAIRKLRDDAFDKLTNAAEHIKKICENARSEVQHVRNDNYQDMARDYARTYVVTKFIQAVQALILKEINMFVTTGIRTLGSFDIKKKEKDYTAKVEEEPEDNSEVKKDDGEEKEKKEESSKESLDLSDRWFESFETLLGDVKRTLLGMGIYKLFHLSTDMSPSKLMVPRKYQEAGPDRICFSPSLKGCFFSASGLNMDTSRTLSVYVIDPSSVSEEVLKQNIVKPTSDQVVDVDITKEVWVTCPVKCVQLAVVQITDKSKRVYAEDKNPQGVPDYSFRNDYNTRNPVLHGLWANFKLIKLNKPVAVSILGLAGYNALKAVYDKQNKE